jgi:hypothetical protein
MGYDAERVEIPNCQASRPITAVMQSTPNKSNVRQQDSISYSAVPNNCNQFFIIPCMQLPRETCHVQVAKLQRTNLSSLKFWASYPPVPLLHKSLTIVERHALSYKMDTSLDLGLFLASNGLKKPAAASLELPVIILWSISSTSHQRRRAFTTPIPTGLD